MIKNYLLIAIRNLLKHKFYAMINVVGLGIGIACVILVGLFVRNELMFNTQHPHADRLYRVIREFRSEEGQKTYDWRISGAVGPALTRDFPEVETAVRTMLRSVWIQHEEKILYRVFCLADSNVLDVFRFPLVQGDKSVLLQPNAVLITQSAAHDYFGDDDPIGKVLTVEGSYISGDYRVAGVLEDLPKQSTIQFDMISASVQPNFTWFWSAWLPRANWRGITVYARLKERASVETLASKMPAMVERYMGPDIAARNTYHFQPLTEMYLHSRRDYGLQEVFSIEGEMTYGDIAHVYGAAATAVFILLIACVNFTNLTTARSAGRAREVGLRKVVGASSGSVVGLFLKESVRLVLVACALAWPIAYWAVDQWLQGFAYRIGISVMPFLRGFQKNSYTAGLYGAKMK